VRAALAGVLIICSVFVATAQQAASTSFDVASVRANTSGEVEGVIGPRPGGYGVRNVSLRLIIIRAYGLRPFQVTGGPGWIDSERFDIDARSPAGTSSDDVLLMLQALLADRFALRVHREQREQPIYALVRAGTNSSLGPQLKASTATCIAPAPNGDSPCRMGGSLTSGLSTLKGVGQPLAALATQLGGSLDRLVVDRTQLTGLFDFDLIWNRALRAAGAADDTPSLFTAVAEQLGLRLEPSRGNVETLVIDSVERPTSN
jgi:uncharacterized protein (TIGR03435 family)